LAASLVTLRVSRPVTLDPCQTTGASDGLTGGFFTVLSEPCLAWMPG